MFATVIQGFFTIRNFSTSQNLSINIPVPCNFIFFCKSEQFTVITFFPDNCGYINDCIYTWKILNNLIISIIHIRLIPVFRSEKIEYMFTGITRKFPGFIHYFRIRVWQYYFRVIKCRNRLFKKMSVAQIISFCNPKIIAMTAFQSLSPLCKNRSAVFRVFNQTYIFFRVIGDDIFNH